MTTDPRKAKTLDQASSNGDGTYNGARALAWLSEALNPGHGVTEVEVNRIFEQVKAKRQQANPG